MERLLKAILFVHLCILVLGLSFAIFFLIVHYLF